MATAKPHTYAADSTINQALNLIASRRVGGALNLKGMGFQLVYACCKILQEVNSQNQNKEVRLEGIEDIDILEINHNEFIQIKSSRNPIDAGKFWEMGVLRNYFEVYKKNQNAQFRFVYNSSIASGKLKDLSKYNYSEELINHWRGKIEKDGNNLLGINFRDFLSKIKFEKTDEKSLLKNCTNILIKNHSINLGTERQFLIALFYSVFEWSKKRTIIKYIDLEKVLQSVKDSFSKIPSNKAINYNWITPVSYIISSMQKEDGYFDGKAARPIHIAMGLPVKREKWENIIYKSIIEFDVTTIRSSSGQGKSTLAWQLAKTLQNSGFFIYQLNYCNDKANVEGIFDFIQSRLLIGQIPLIVVDGIDKSVQAWGILMNRIAELPVKVIVTSRQEDWYRYGLDASKSNLNIIDIELSINEAKNIFNQLNSKGKIHSNIKKWEPIWEKIESKGLLIEYVYLLTQGKMIEERLQDQIKNLNKEKDASAKIEILRWISLADILNIKIETTKLIKYIQHEIGLQSDRGELLKQLEKEYYVQFDGKYVEGLHPVRSKHLVDILHETISIENSLLTLLDNIGNEFIYDFFISVPFLVCQEGKSEFYEESAKILSNKKYLEMVYAIDGLMHNEPYRYWFQNKNIFDSVFDNGSLGLFVYDTVPFTKLNTIKNMRKLMGDKNSNFDFCIGKLNELLPYDINESALMLFAKNLSQLLKKNNKLSIEYNGLGFLVKWFKQLNLPLPTIPEINKKKLIEILKDKELEESSNLFDYFYTTNPKEYDQLINKYKSNIISILKKKTKSLTIEEIGDDININYLLYNNANANEHSVSRIKTIYQFLPYYNKYCTKAIVLPFPNEDICKAVIQESTKAMPKKNIIDSFDIHINQIWSKTILDKYAASSVFEWQEEFFKLRQNGVEFAKMCNRYFEALIEDDSNRIKSSANTLAELISFLTGLIITRKSYPTGSNRYNDQKVFKGERGDIADWCSNLKNFLSQLVGIIKPQGDNETNIAIINLKSVALKLLKMQSAFKTIQTGTIKYFPSHSISKEETEWYERLLHTVLFFIHQSSNPIVGKVVFAKHSVNKWWLTNLEQKLTQIHSIIRQYETESHFKFHLPNRVIEDEYSKSIVIGVDRIEPINLEEDFLDLLGGLVDFTNTDITFFTFVNIYEKIAVGAFRIQNKFFKKIKLVLNGGEFEQDEIIPLPVEVNEELLGSLEGINCKPVLIEKKYEFFSEMMLDVWKLGEYRRRLNIENEIEKMWLEKIEQKYIKKINDNLNKNDLKNGLTKFKSYKVIIEQFIENKIELSPVDIVNHLNTIIVDATLEISKNKYAKLLQ